MSCATRNDSNIQNMRTFFVCAFAITLIAPVLAASPVCAIPWVNGDYLARWVFWGLRHQVSPSDDYTRISIFQVYY